MLTANDNNNNDIRENNNNHDNINDDNIIRDRTHECNDTCDPPTLKKSTRRVAGNTPSWYPVVSRATLRLASRSDPSGKTVGNS